ncbi:hypothetical protein ACOMHN_057320 [Nucella lapillus]
MNITPSRVQTWARLKFESLTDLEAWCRRYGGMMEEAFSTAWGKAGSVSLTMRCHVAPSAGLFCMQLLMPTCNVTRLICGNGCRDDSHFSR